MGLDVSAAAPLLLAPFEFPMDGCCNKAAFERLSAAVAPPFDKVGESAGTVALKRPPMELAGRALTGRPVFSRAACTAADAELMLEFDVSDDSEGIPGFSSPQAVDM